MNGPAGVAVVALAALGVAVIVAGCGILPVARSPGGGGIHDDVLGVCMSENRPRRVGREP